MPAPVPVSLKSRKLQFVLSEPRGLLAHLAGELAPLHQAFAVPGRLRFGGRAF